MRKSSATVIECIHVDVIGEDNETKMTITEGWHALLIGGKATKEYRKNMELLYN